MHSTEVIKNACADGLEKIEESAEWRGEYCSIVDPSCTLELVHKLEKYEQIISGDELQALGKLVRDLTEHIKLTLGDTPGPARDDTMNCRCEQGNYPG